MNTKEYVYSWHLSLRADRPVEGCPMRPHAYMYGKKLDERDMEKANMQPHTKIVKEPPPAHEFSYRWFRGPLYDPCAYNECPRRLSYSPHDWSKHALGGQTDCALQCVSTQSSLYKSTFCNSSCFVKAWKTQQYTVPKDVAAAMMMMNSPGGATTTTPLQRNFTPSRSRSGSLGSNDEDLLLFADNETSSVRSGESPAPDSSSNSNSNNNGSATPPSSYHGGGTGGAPGSTPRGYVGGYNNSSNNNNNSTNNKYHHQHGYHPPTEYNAGDDWIEISREQMFVPGPDDVGRKLKLEAAAYSTETGEMLMSRVVKTDVVLARAPDPRKRGLVTVVKSTSHGGPGARFRVATYNTLAEIYATGQQYPYCDFWALNWEYRFHNIMREIMDANPDVLCLQEIQADHYETHVYVALSEAGYEGVFKQKTRQSMGLAGKVDGCGLFWKRSKFHLVESYSIEFNEVAQRQCSQVLGINPRSEEGVAFLNRLSKDNVAQLVVLEFVQAPRTGREINQVCIANTHLYSNKDFPDVKLWQSWQLLQELESFIMSRGANLPLIICGDFNSTPDTAVYDLLSRQAVHPGHPDVNVATGDDVPNVLPDPMQITHSFQLGSAYQTVMGEEPWTTNYTVNFKGTLDYIWYSAQNLRPLSAAPIPDEAQLTERGEALPSTEFSSDHVMLISDFQVLGLK